MAKFLDKQGLQHLWSKISMEDYPNNETLMAVIAAIDETKADKSDIITADSILQKIYPVGAIYLSVTEIDPATIFGFGTWEQIKDTFLLAAGDTYTAGSTGGEATHTLNIEEMPSHLHDISSSLMWANRTGDVQSGTKTYYARSGAQTTQLTGGSQPHNNMPPYLTVYMWKRIA